MCIRDRCSAGCFHPVYEPVFLDSLPDDLISAPALQCRDGAEKRHISDCFVSNLCRLFCSYAAAYADYDIWNNEMCIRDRYYRKPDFCRSGRSPD